jgi:hypothetical protein
VPALFRRVLILVLVLAPLSAFAFSEWQDPTPEELKMTSYPADPNAPAVFLYREEKVDDDIHIHTFYARVKILSEKGKEMFGDIEIPYEAGATTIRGISGRTIHSDGTVVPFTGGANDKLLVRQGGVRMMEKVFSMPDVQVGSILEYKFVLGYPDDYVRPPHWVIQQSVPVLKAHYHFVPSTFFMHGTWQVTSREQGHENVANLLLYSVILPPGDKVNFQADHSYDLTVENIPAVPHDDYLPPFRSLTYRVLFYYSSFGNAAEYWKTEGKYWSKDFDRFANPSNKIRSAVNDIVAPGDNDQQKVQKIYAVVMKLENTSFTREHSAEENKAEGLKVKNAEDIWAQQRGSDDEITRLFVAMVRAAGLRAFGAAVVNRDEDVFNPSYLSWSQLEDELAIVSIDGKEVFLDPGQRYCEFGKLHWKHTMTEGIRQTGDGTQRFPTQQANYKENDLERVAKLSLDADGHVNGRIYETMTGAEALRWRQAALRGDEADVKKQFEEELQHSMPPGVQVKTNHFVSLTDYTNPLIVVADVSGTLGTQTGKHLFLPAVFFEAGNAPLFSETQRENPVDMHYPYMVHDDVQLTLPPNISVESLPPAGDVPFLPNADYIAKFVTTSNGFAYGRLFRAANFLYLASEYPDLREFCQKVSAADQQQVALKIAPVTVAGPPRRLLLLPENDDDESPSVGNGSSLFCACVHRCACLYSRIARLGDPSGSRSGEYVGGRTSEGSRPARGQAAYRRPWRPDYRAIPASNQNSAPTRTQICCSNRVV